MTILVRYRRYVPYCLERFLGKTTLKKIINKSTGVIAVIRSYCQIRSVQSAIANLTSGLPKSRLFRKIDGPVATQDREIYMSSQLEIIDFDICRQGAQNRTTLEHEYVLAQIRPQNNDKSALQKPCLTEN